MTKFVLAATVAALMLPSVAQAQQTVTECDKLVSHAEDPDRVAPGIDDVKDKPAAIAACESDVMKDPNNRRLRYQLGRVLFYDQQTAKAMPHLEFAATAGLAASSIRSGLYYRRSATGLKARPLQD